MGRFNDALTSVEKAAALPGVEREADPDLARMEALLEP